LLRASRRGSLDPADISIDKRYVLAANHQAAIDPFILTGQISTQTWDAMGWPRIFAMNRFFSYPVVGTIVKCLGSFPAKDHPVYPSGLTYANYALDHGSSVMIFPEGRVTLHREHDAKIGVQVLAQQPDVMIIPVHIEWARPRILARFRIGIGKPIDASGMTAQQILEYIYRLPVK
jgi:1-acyl-sn-glycerol-3-phosphate acyltransferase